MDPFYTLRIHKMNLKFFDIKIFHQLHNFVHRGRYVSKIAYFIRICRQNNRKVMVFFNFKTIWLFLLQLCGSYTTQILVQVNSAKSWLNISVTLYYFYIVIFIIRIGSTLTLTLWPSSHHMHVATYVHMSNSSTYTASKKSLYL